MNERPPAVPPYTVLVTADKAGTRLDRVLAAALAELSRNRVQQLLAAGQVVLAADGEIVRDPARCVRLGETYAVTVPPPPPSTAIAQPIPLDVVFEDDHLIVIEKPAGLAVHPGAGTPDGTLVNALLAHCEGGLSPIGAPLRPGIVHRLDKDTTGLLVAAKTEASHRSLAAQFAMHSVERAYHAVVWGHPIPASGRMTTRIGRSDRDRTQMAIVAQGGKEAITDYRTLRWLGASAALLECRLATGRTHQIRVHMAALGHPLVGDPVYRGRRQRFAASTGDKVLTLCPRQALHAFLIGFIHPETGIKVRFESSLPHDINSLISFLEGH